MNDVKNSEIIENLVEVQLVDDKSFLVVKETLTRIGVASKKSKTLFQTCHILQKRGLYYIVMFKELFLLDGKPTSLDDTDIRRRNTIVRLLTDWKLLEPVRPEQIVDQLPMSQLKVIPFSEKPEWTLVEKYRIGKQNPNYTKRDGNY